MLLFERIDIAGIEPIKDEQEDHYDQPDNQARLHLAQICGYNVVSRLRKFQGSPGMGHAAGPVFVGCALPHWSLIGDATRGHRLPLNPKIELNGAGLRYGSPHWQDSLRTVLVYPEHHVFRHP